MHEKERPSTKDYIMGDVEGTVLLRHINDVAVAFRERYVFYEKDWDAPIPSVGVIVSALVLDIIAQHSRLALGGNKLADFPHPIVDWVTTFGEPDYDNIDSLVMGVPQLFEEGGGYLDNLEDAWPTVKSLIRVKRLG